MVVLFDVDGTLIDTGGSVTRSWSTAFERLYGVRADIGDYSSAGQTDPQVARATLVGVLHRDPAQDELSNLYAQYRLYLAEDIWTSEKYRVLAGAEQTLVRLEEAAVMLGLTDQLEAAGADHVLASLENAFPGL